MKPVIEFLSSPPTTSGFFAGTTTTLGFGGTSGFDRDRQEDDQVLDLIPPEAFKAAALLQGIPNVSLGASARDTLRNLTAADIARALRQEDEMGLFDSIGDVLDSIGGAVSSAGEGLIDILGNVGGEILGQAQDIGGELLQQLPDLAAGELRNLFGLDDSSASPAAKPAVTMMGASAAGGLSPRAAQIRETLRRTAPKLCNLTNAQFESLARGDTSAANLSLQSAICLDVNTSDASRAAFTAAQQQDELLRQLAARGVSTEPILGSDGVPVSIQGFQQAGLPIGAALSAGGRGLAAAVTFLGLDRAADAGIEALSDLLGEDDPAVQPQRQLSAGRGFPMAALPPVVIDLAQVPGSDGFTFPRRVLITNAAGEQRDYRWPGRAVLRSGDVSASKRVTRVARKARASKPRARRSSSNVMALAAPRIVTACSECRSAPCSCS